MSSTNPDPKSIGELIRKARLLAGLSQEELAARAKLSLSTLKNAERGRYPISDKTIASLQQVLGPLLATQYDFGSDALNMTYRINRYHQGQMAQEFREKCKKNNSLLPIELVCLTEDSTKKFIDAHLDSAYFDYFLSEEITQLVRFAKRIIKECKGEAVDIISISCGHGWIDIEFAHQLATILQKCTDLYLIHPSSHLGSKICSEYTSRRYDQIVSLFLIQNRHHRFSLPLKQSRVAHRVFCMFGTLVNSDSLESLFDNIFRNSMPGDFMLMDITDVHSEKFNGKDRLDPYVFDYRLSGEVPFSKKITSYINAAINSASGWKEEDSIANVIYLPGDNQFFNYTVDLRVTSFLQGREITLSGLRIRRIGVALIVSFLYEKGWVLLEHCIIGLEKRSSAKTHILLFIRK